jgi:hypothetical protein
MRKYALVNNNIVTNVISFEEEDFEKHSKLNDLIIDIEDLNPQPAAGWILNGNKLEIPQGNSSREQFEIELATRKTDFGIRLARIAVDRVGARNKILNKSGTQVTTLLNQLMGIKLLLETGALGTARLGCIQLKVVYTEYTDILDYVIQEVNDFEKNFGL